MQVNSISNYKPAFQAKFSDDNKTKSILREGFLPYKHNGSYEVYASLSLLNKIDSDDEISLTQLPKESGDYFNKFSVKNNMSGGQIKITTRYNHSLFQILNKIIASADSNEHKKLFGNSNSDIDSLEGKSYLGMCEELDIKSGADVLEKESQILFEKNKELEREIKKNSGKIDKLFDEQNEKRSEYMFSIVG